MLKFTLAAFAVIFAGASLIAPAEAAKRAKSAPGMCGKMMYFDAKSKKCKVSNPASSSNRETY